MCKGGDLETGTSRESDLVCKDPVGVPTDGVSRKKTGTTGFYR